MRIKPFPLSLSFAGQLRAAVFFPSDDNSKASPVDTFRSSAIFGSIRAIFLPTSRCSATSATFRLVVGLELVRPLLLVLLLLSVLRLSFILFDTILQSLTYILFFIKVVTLLSAH